MRKILINKRGEFETKRKDYAMTLAVKRFAQLVGPNTQGKPKEKVEILYTARCDVKNSESE